ncbi:MAG: 4Fe-4S binding protein [Syntrophomonadaceae bacterium]|jgi:ferredoxin|nr:4Fe-4S binding protein [Syntrophomonadaceae bacterium]
MYVDDSCIGCGVCVDTCPVGAISIIDEKAFIDTEICLECEACIDVCPLEAIHEE